MTPPNLAQSRMLRTTIQRWMLVFGLFLVLGAAHLVNAQQEDPNAAPADAEAAADAPTAPPSILTDLSNEQRARDEFPARPTPFEIENTTEEVDRAFKNFLQLWNEERYFELYDFGKKRSRDFIVPEEFATRMVKLPWVPVGLAEENAYDIDFRFRTFIYVAATIQFRHKTNSSLEFKKRQTYLLVWEENRWRFDLLQMLRAPFYAAAEEELP